MRIRKHDKDEKADERTALEQQVDAMMDPKRPEEPAPAPDNSSEPEERPKIRSVSSAAPAKTAPQLSAELRSQLGISDADTKPLSIDKLDEVAKKVTVKAEDEPDEDKSADEGPAPEAAAEDPATNPDPEENSTDLDDARTEEAVDDIVAHEGDIMLALDDATKAERTRKYQAEHPEKKGHPVISTIFWTFIIFLVIAAALIVALFVTGGNVTGLKL